jgi:hypothetical protein
LQQASTTREAERYKIHLAKPGPLEGKKKREGAERLVRDTHPDASKGMATRDERRLSLELLGQPRRRKFFCLRMVMAHGERLRAYSFEGHRAARVCSLPQGLSACGPRQSTAPSQSVDGAYRRNRTVLVPRPTPARASRRASLPSPF